MKHAVLWRAVANAMTGEGHQVMAEAQKHLDHIQAHWSKLVWKHLPAPPGIRSYEGVGGGYTVMVAQYGRPDGGFAYKGMGTFDGGVIVVMGGGLAETIFKNVTNQRN